MTTNQKQSLKHVIAQILALLLPILPVFLANVHWGVWTNVEQAVLAVLGAIYVDLTGQPASVLTSAGGDQVNISTK
jgi:hypothetical protein